MAAPLVSTGLAPDRVRARLLGGTLRSFEREGACLRVRVLIEGESASSSPEASLEEGCCSSTAEDLSRSEAEVRFRFADPVDEGEDMMILWTRASPDYSVI